ncbi:uncharacterized protein LODBEIA_P34820 [Lodderomyces beijingensis]|uniref:L-serine ammonia-lyase n=1 Tax=Lodderomyces beijingensis TaxID=1775926 RepID=A0ABP0ZNK6_9ASCO
MQLPSVKTSLVDVTEKIKDAPCRILFKNELEQPSGSFKLRGLGYLVARKIAQAQQSGKSDVIVYSSSGGNAGLAAGYAARFYKVKCTVVLPKVSKANVVEKLKSMGAEVIIHGKHWGEADAHLRNVVMEQAGESVEKIYCHPFDNPLVWEGHSKIIEEILEEQQLANFDKVRGVICSVGGGGLYNGLVEGLRKYRVPVLAMETKQAPTFNEAASRGEVVHLDSVDTLANSLGSPYLAAKALENYKSHPTYLGMIDDLDAAQATVDLYDDFGLLVEPACGASAAAVLRKNQLPRYFPDLQPDEILIVIICGGSGINEEIIEQYRGLLKQK